MTNPSNQETQEAITLSPATETQEAPIVRIKQVPRPSLRKLASLYHRMKCHNPPANSQELNIGKALITIEINELGEAVAQVSVPGYTLPGTYEILVRLSEGDLIPNPNNKQSDR